MYSQGMGHLRTFILWARSDLGQQSRAGVNNSVTAVGKQRRGNVGLECKGVITCNLN